MDYRSTVLGCAVLLLTAWGWRLRERHRAGLTVEALRLPLWQATGEVDAVMAHLNTLVDRLPSQLGAEIRAALRQLESAHEIQREVCTQRDRAVMFHRAWRWDEPQTGERFVLVEGVPARLPWNLGS